MSRIYGTFGFMCGFLMIIAFLFNFQEKPYILFVGGIVCVMLNFCTNILLHIYGEMIETRKLLDQVYVDNRYFNVRKIEMITPVELPMTLCEVGETKPKAKKKPSRKKVLTKAK